MPDAARGDAELDEVYDNLAGRAGLGPTIGKALRQAFDEVIDCQRTGRYSIEQLEKTEKTYIGTKVEIVLRTELDLERGQVLDNLIAGHEVDTKFTLGNSWMIPQEAVDQICLLVTARDDGRFSMGLIRAARENLTSRPNQDRKHSISSCGRAAIRWLVSNARMPPNFLSELEAEKREAILRETSAPRRLRALFRNVTLRLIPRSVIIQVAQVRGDPLKRAREAKAPMASEGFEVLCAKYRSDRSRMLSLGFRPSEPDDWLSVPVR